MSILSDILMPDDLPTPSKALYLFFEFIALGFGLEAVAALVKGEHWWKWTACFVGAAIFLWLGVKSPGMKAGVARLLIRLEAWLPWVRISRLRLEATDLKKQIANLEKSLRLERLSEEDKEGIAVSAIFLDHAEFAKSLLSILEKLKQRWTASGETLNHPISSTLEIIDVSRIPEDILVDLMDFKNLYCHHIRSVRDAFPLFRTNAIICGCPSEEPYSEVLHNLDNHWRLLEEEGNKLWAAPRSLDIHKYWADVRQPEKNFESLLQTVAELRERCLQYETRIKPLPVLTDMGIQAIRYNTLTLQRVWYEPFAFGSKDHRDKVRFVITNTWSAEISVWVPIWESPEVNYQEPVGPFRVEGPKGWQADDWMANETNSVTLRPQQSFTGWISLLPPSGEGIEVRLTRVKTGNLIFAVQVEGKLRKESVAI
ncbi:MAG TPA: hypothetical protein VMI94_24030 [Bryobacteraceae bacterium]|nr:hypothetical protein [Bryobacteraceae bacterium]